MCHGESGKGDGPASVALNPKPRNYTDKEWQKTVTDEQIKEDDRGGGGASMGKSPLMPAQADLSLKTGSFWMVWSKSFARSVRDARQAAILRGACARESSKKRFTVMS